MADFSPEQQQAPLFIATPDRMAPLLQMREEEVGGMLQSVRGRQELMTMLIEREEEIKVLHPDFQPDIAREQLDAVAEALEAKDRYLKEIEKPENKNLFRRAFEKVKGFVSRHKVALAFLALALLGGGLAWYYREALLALLQQLGLWGGGEAAAVEEAAGTAAAEGATELLSSEKVVNVMIDGDSYHVLKDGALDIWDKANYRPASIEEVMELAQKAEGDFGYKVRVGMRDTATAGAENTLFQTIRNALGETSLHIAEDTIP